MTDDEPDPEDLNEIDVVYATSDQYQIYPASGARGGVQAQGDFKLDFTLDYTADPAVETHEVTETGLGEMVSREGELRIIREKQVGVSLSQRHALSVAGWMIASILGPDVEEEDILNLIEEEYSEKFEQTGGDQDVPTN